MNPANSLEPDSAPLKTDIVSNIPMHTAGGPAVPAKVDDNLDKIMQDVGHELKKEDVKPAKHHFFSKEQKPDVHPSRSAPSQSSAQPHQAQQSTANPQAKTKPQTKAPVLVITVTLIVTAALIAAAYSVYKS